MIAARLTAIAKSYGDVHANDGVDLEIRAGTIHALIGENGAGKSTAMKILFGLVQPDRGTISFGGREVFKDGKGDWDPVLAFGQGIGMVHQHFMLAGPESVHDNLVLGVETCNALGIRDRKTERAALEALMKKSGLTVPLDVPLETLPIGQQSRVEILKVLYRNAKFLILDEPTSVLTPNEIEEFLNILRRLRDQGCTILIVTHKLKEVMAVADDATVLRAGRTVAARKISQTSLEELSELMVGRHLVMPKADAPELGESRVKLEHLDLRAGQIIGIAGVEGNGQEALAQKLIDCVEMNPVPLALIPADRHHEGLVLGFTLYENLRLTRRLNPFIPGWRPFGSATDEECAMLKEYDVRPPEPGIHAGALSGGNQQKLIVARELSGFPSAGVVLAIHPTRGVDLGAIEFIHARILDAAAKGAAVLLISSELDELMALSHKIGAIYEGKIAKWFDGPAYDEKQIGIAMLGGAV